MKKSFILGIVLVFLCGFGVSEEEGPDLNPLYIMANQLNGRARPNKKSTIEARFDHDDEVFPTGKWSADRQWVEVFGGETGTVWCSVDYLTERDEVFTVYSLNKGGIRIRSKPGAGKVTGTIRKEQRVEITQVVMGYGKCKKGWVDLSYFIEEE